MDDTNAALRKRFVTELAQHPNLGSAARAAGISRQVAEQWLADDPDFAERCEQARADWQAQLYRSAQERSLICYWSKVPH